MYQNYQNVKVLPQHHGILNPRDKTQVRNCHKSEREKLKLSHDSLYNLLLLAYELGDFIHHITLFPDLICVAGLKSIIKEFNKLLECDTDDIQMYCSYDTTFCIGDFYVSVLVFRHVLFNNSPVIPLAFLIHDRKFAKTHELFFSIINELVPNLKKYPIPLIVDREYGISNAIKTMLPNCPLFHCWNHLKRDFRHYLSTKLRAPFPDIQVYTEDLDTLLQSENEADFIDASETLTAKWSEAALDYYHKTIKPDILTYSGKWLIAPHNIFDPYSGITTNISEGMNTVIKRLLKWSEVPVDSAALAFNFLQNYFYVEIHRGFCGVGDYSLRSKFGKLLRDKESIPILECYSPQTIVDKVKGRFLQLLPDKNKISQPPKTNCDGPDAIDDGLPITDGPPKGDGPPNPDGPLPVTDGCDKVNDINDGPLYQRTPYALAQKIIDENRIEYCPKMKSFTVKTGTGNLYSLKLFPKEKCWCGGTITCCHILAARIYMGIDCKDEIGVRHLTQLKRKKRANADKTSGRKQPRQHDILPAPDSILADEGRLNEVLEIDEWISSTPVKCSSPKPCKTPLKSSRKITISSPKLNKTSVKSSPKISTPKRTFSCNSPKSLLKEKIVTKIERQKNTNDFH